MKPALPGTDLLPWYRQFWPWFLIALPGTVVVAAIGTLVIAQRGADDLVVDEYYRDGLAINRRLEKQQRAQQLGLQAILRLGRDSAHLRLQPPGDYGTLRLDLSHPLQAKSDFSVELSPIAPGEYAAHLPREAGPRWHWALQPADGQWRLDGVVSATDLDHERTP
ncbi:MAG: hypothetical protein CME59_07480 [Halioglobus sp.]|nr:hypothetical protein [Halioglobus sp.]